MDVEFETWKKTPTPQSLSALLNKADPVINSALSSYAGGNKAFRGEAKALAIDAFQTYDPTKGTKLQTHLMTQLQPLHRAYRSHTSTTYTPEKVTFDLNRVRKAEQELFDKNGREASDQEIADFTGVSTKRLMHVRKFARPDVPESKLTETTEDGETSTFYPGTEKADPQKVWMEYVHHDLAPVDQKILEWKTGLYGKQVLSTAQIAKNLGITPGAVSQRAARISAKVAEGQGLEG